jgi:hypothetical protein
MTSIKRARMMHAQVAAIPAPGACDTRNTAKRRALVIAEPSSGGTVGGRKGGETRKQQLAEQGETEEGGKMTVCVLCYGAACFKLRLAPPTISHLQSLPRAGLLRDGRNGSQKRWLRVSVNCTYDVISSTPSKQLQQPFGACATHSGCLFRLQQ